MDDPMDDFGELNDEAKKFNAQFPPLGPNEVYSATLEMAAVKFPSPAHARAFFAAVSMMIEKLANKLGLEVIKSTTGIGVALKVEGNNNGLDLSKFKN